jgi:hypothetical protein
MDKWNILELVMNVISLLAILYLLFFKNYFAQKGKNLATIEDIETITQKVEDVKHSVGELSLRRNDNFLEFKKSLVDFNREIIKWISISIKDISVIFSDPFDKECIKEKLSNLQLQASEVETAFFKISIFLKPEDDTWLENLRLSYLDINPYFYLTRDLFEESYGLSTRLNLSKENPTQTTQILEELNIVRNKFIRERPEVENKALNAQIKVTNIIRYKLLKQYNFE